MAEVTWLNTFAFTIRKRFWYSSMPLLSKDAWWSTSGSSI